MSAIPFEKNILPLPTLQNLGVDPSLIPTDLQPKQIVEDWLTSFSDHAVNANVDGVVDLLIQNAYWRDLLALTWNLRTFAGSAKIKTFLQDRLAVSKLKNLSLAHPELLIHAQPAPGLQWIQFFFKFEVGDVGSGLGVGRLVPTPQGKNGIAWKAHAILTSLEELKGFPESTGIHRKSTAYAGNNNWIQQRADERAYQDSDPTVLVVGGAQAGLDIAARLKMLGVRCLVVEKGDRIGGNWINRYTSLRLHDPVWYDHMPYLPFPPNWPVFSPAAKLANWLQYYAEAMELDVWIASTVTKASRNSKTGLWAVTVISRYVNPDGTQTETERIFNVKHLVFATGLIPTIPKFPTYPGMDQFKGDTVHAYKFKTGADYKGKKVVVIGACTSAHDICADCHHHGVDVTMYQRGSTYIMSTENGLKVLMGGLYSEDGPPTDLADRISASFPNSMMVEISQQQTKMIAALDKDILDGLHKRGFRTTMGILDTGFPLLVWSKAGGYYLDTGACQLVIDGKIKLKNDSQIKEFTASGIRFENGSELSADVVVFATGLGDLREEMGNICGPDILDKVGPLWGLDEDGEIQGVARDLGIPGLWCLMGNLMLCRFHSKQLALQIKAIEENLFGERYTKYT